MENREQTTKEILFHHRFLCWLDEFQIRYDTWGASGPDVLLLDYDVLGEFKIEESKSSYKLAFQEIQKRQREMFKITNFKFFFVLTKEYIRVYRTSSVDWSKPHFNVYLNAFNFTDNAIATFRNNESEKELFIEYIKSNFQKIPIDAHIDRVLKVLLSGSLNISVKDAIFIVCNLNAQVVPLRESIVYNAGQSNEYTIELSDPNTYAYIRKFVIERYYIRDIYKVRAHIKFNYSSYLPDAKKSNLGKYYTPINIVNVIKEWVFPLITEDTYVMDLACGCGAFMEIFDDCHILGRDIDQDAIDVLTILGIANIQNDNSLSHVCRAKYNLTNDDRIVIVGNPPYNDSTSKNKRYGTNAKTSLSMEIDEDIKAKDLGQSFLLAYAKLNPEYICVLHPLSYLIKKSNFNRLGKFTRNYALKKGLIFPSSLFPDLSRNSVFPVVVALYERGNMDFHFIQSFHFELLGSTENFVLNHFTTIDDIHNGKRYIHKYPIKVSPSQIKESDIGLYQYNIRDTNSLMSSGNLMSLDNTSNTNYVTVSFKDLYKYAYLNMYKHFFKNHYLVGNLSPLINIDEYENDMDLQNLMIIGTILKNCRRLKCFDFNDMNSFVYTKFLFNDFKKRAKHYQGSYNFYVTFINIVQTGNTSLAGSIYNLISNYFDNLRKSFLGF